MIEEKIKLADFEKALAKGNSVIKERFDAEKAEIAAMDAWWADELSSVDDDVNAMFEENLNRLVENTKKKGKLTADEIVGTAMSVANATSSLLSGLSDMYESDTEDAEKNAKKIKSLRIAEATINTISGAIGALTSAAVNPGGIPGMIIGAANAAAITAAGIAQIAQMKKTTKTSSGTISAPNAVVSAPNVETNLQTVRNITSATEEERLNQMAKDQRVYILSSDIEASLGDNKTRVAESSF